MREAPVIVFNMAIAEDLIAAGRMHTSGLAEVESAKADGRWAAAYGSPRRPPS